MEAADAAEGREDTEEDKDEDREVELEVGAADECGTASPFLCFSVPPCCREADAPVFEGGGAAAAAEAAAGGGGGGGGTVDVVTSCCRVCRSRTPFGLSMRYRCRKAAITR